MLQRTEVLRIVNQIPTFSADIAEKQGIFTCRDDSYLCLSDFIARLGAARTANKTSAPPPVQLRSKNGRVLSPESSSKEEALGKGIQAHTFLLHPTL